MKLTFYCTPHFCVQWPRIKVILNNKEINTFQITEENPSATINLELDSVYEVYEFKANNGWSRYFCDEVLKGFPTLKYIDTIYDKEAPFSEAQASLYKNGFFRHDAPPGQVADLLAIYLFLLFWCYDYKIT